MTSFRPVACRCTAANVSYSCMQLCRPVTGVRAGLGPKAVVGALAVCMQGLTMGVCMAVEVNDGSWVGSVQVHSSRG